MAKKDPDARIGNESNEDPKIIARVDAMMATERNEPSAEPEPKSALEEDTRPATVEDSPQPPPLDIFADAPGAPLLSGKPAPKPTKTRRAKRKIKVAVAGQPEDVPVAAAKPSSDSEDDPDIQAAASDPPKPEDYDDPETAKAIEEIVAEEGDTTLKVQDAQLEQIKEENSAAPREGRSFRWFWILVVIVCLIAIGMAVYIADPNLHNPLSKLHWSTIKRHL